MGLLYLRTSEYAQNVQFITFFSDKDRFHNEPCMYLFDVYDLISRIFTVTLHERPEV